MKSNDWMTVNSYLKMMCRKRRLQHNWGTVPNFLTGLRKSTGNFSQDRRCRVWDANREPPECKWGLLLLDPTCVTSCVVKTRLGRSESAQATTVKCQSVRPQASGKQTNAHVNVLFTPSIHYGIATLERNLKLNAVTATPFYKRCFG